MNKRFVLEFERPIYELEIKLGELKKLPPAATAEMAGEIEALEAEIHELRQRTFTSLGPWQRVQIARHPDRPRASDYIDTIFTNFKEIKGDRLYNDDPSVLGGIASFNGQKVIVVGQQKGKNLKDNIHRRFGMSLPEGFRKAKRLFLMAETLKVPVITFIDTPGAYPGLESEKHGVAFAIAENLMTMSLLHTPVLSFNIGEGGSGGALGISVADRIYMLENSYYSVISPEGCASILWRDETKAEEAANVLKLTAEDLLAYGIIDGVIKEPFGGAHTEPRAAMKEVSEVIVRDFAELSKLAPQDIVEQRYQKYRCIGEFSKVTAPSS